MLPFMIFAVFDVRMTPLILYKLQLLSCCFIVIVDLEPLAFDIHTKFQVASFSRSEDMAGVKKFQKYR